MSKSNKAPLMVQNRIRACDSWPVYSIVDVYDIQKKCGARYAMYIYTLTFQTQNIIHVLLKQSQKCSSLIIESC